MGEHRKVNTVKLERTSAIGQSVFILVSFELGDESGGVSYQLVDGDVACPDDVHVLSVRIIVDRDHRR